MNIQYKQKLLGLLDSIDGYIDHINEEVKNINLNKISYEDELRYLFHMNQLDIHPHDSLLHDSYLSLLNGKVNKTICPPDPRDVFDGVQDCDADNRVFAANQQPVARPPNNYCISKNGLPNPMKQILGFEQRQEIELANNETLMCVAYKLGQGESECLEWNIVTGNEQSWFEIKQTSALVINESTGIPSIPWEGSQHITQLQSIQSMNLAYQSP